MKYMVITNNTWASFYSLKDARMFASKNMYDRPTVQNMKGKYFSV